MDLTNTEGNKQAGQAVTFDSITNRIVDVRYQRVEGTTLTVCVLTLANGFYVIGESACVDPANFDKKKGEEIAYKNAFEQIWKLEGYLLREKLAADEIYNHPMNVVRRKVEFEHKIARVCHEVNRAICQAAGDESQPPFSAIPEWQLSSTVDGIRLHLMSDGEVSAEETHNNWCRHKIDNGWVYGEVKDPVAKTHPCLVPYHSLPFEHKVKDHVFKALVHTLAEIL